MDSGHTASGGTTAEPGIAVYNRATLGGYWQVTDARTGKTVVLKQTDLGPHPSTGRSIDVTYSAIGKFGYGQNNFPTDSRFKATYIGRTPSRALAHQGPQTSQASARANGQGGVQQTAQPQTQSLASIEPLLSGKSGFDIGKPTAKGLGDPLAPIRAAGLFNPPTALPTQPGVTPQQVQPGRAQQSLSPTPQGRYANPLAHAQSTPGRVDEGIDPTVHGRIDAIGNGKVVNISHNFYKGLPYIVYQLTDGPRAGQYVYISENVRPNVKVGQTVRAGQQIATGLGGTEQGFAGGPKGSYMPAANRAQGGNYTEGLATRQGKAYQAFIRSLGGKA